MRQRAEVTLTALAQPSACRDLVRDAAVTWQERRTTVELDAGDVCVLAFTGPYNGDVLAEDVRVDEVK